MGHSARNSLLFGKSSLISLQGLTDTTNNGRPKRLENVYAEVPTMFGISLTQPIRLESNSILKAPGFGISKRAIPTLSASVPVFMCCLPYTQYPFVRFPHRGRSRLSLPCTNPFQMPRQLQPAARPVLVMFTAEWSPASAQLRKHVLTDADAVSLLSACFECVLIDVDAHPDIQTNFKFSTFRVGVFSTRTGTW